MKGAVDSEAAAVLFIGLFFGMLIFLGSLGSNIFAQSVNPSAPDCDNQSKGFECSKSLTDTISSYIGLTSANSGINYVVLTPLGILIAWLIIKILPLT